MKVSEFIALSDEEKVIAMENAGGKYESVTEDLAKCSQCGKEVYVDSYCFGCHAFVCGDCFEEEPHYSRCLG